MTAPMAGPMPGSNPGGNGDRTMETTYITLRLDYDPTDGLHPGRWDWTTMLDLPDRDAVEVVRTSPADHECEPNSGLPVVNWFTLLDDFEAELREELDLEDGDLDDQVSEYADSNVPVYNATILAYAWDNFDLLLTTPELGDGDEDPLTRIRLNIYDELFRHGMSVLDDMREEAEDAAAEREDAGVPEHDESEAAK